jgi:hypothetical protein
MSSMAHPRSPSRRMISPSTARFCLGIREVHQTLVIAPPASAALGFITALRAEGFSWSTGQCVICSGRKQSLIREISPSLWISFQKFGC